MPSEIREDARAGTSLLHSPHVVVDARMVRHSGIGTYLRNVVPRVAALRPGWRFTFLGPAETLSTLGWADRAGAGVVDCDAPLYSVREQMELPRLVPRDASLFWTPHYVIPIALRQPLLVTVQDVFHLAMPQLVGGLARRLYARLMFGAVRRRAKRVLFTSEFTRGEFARLVGVVPPSAVVPLGVGEQWRTAASGPRPLAAPYVLYVGNVKPHKNVATLLRAFERIASRVPHHLVIVGRVEGMRTADAEVLRLAERRPDRVHVTGEVDDETLGAWMANADAFAFPSLYEGFGLPPLESMASGCPCLVARSASLPEVCGDAAHYCDPRDEADVAERLHEMLTDDALRERLRERGRARAASYTWERCAAGTVREIEEALAE